MMVVLVSSIDDAMTMADRELCNEGFDAGKVKPKC
jgi:hypothetical protein